MTTDVTNADELAAVLQEIEASQRTGTMFIRTQDGHMSMLAFDKGTLIGVSHGGHKGVSALPLILKFSSGTYSMEDASLIRRQGGLPTVQELAAMLKNAVVPAEQATPAPTPQKPATDEFPVDRVFERISQVLIIFLGPIGTMLCKKTAARLGTHASRQAAWAAVMELANDVDSLADRDNFLMQAEKILQEYYHS